MEGLPVVDEWFVRRRLDEQISLVTEPHIHPLLRCNVWHVQGRDLDLVVDTSMGLSPLRSLVERELAGGLLAVATHSHVDHIGGLHEFDQRAAHPAEAPILEKAALASVETAHYPATVLGPYRDAGYEIGDLLLDAVPPDGPRTAVYEVAAAAPTRLVENGDVIDLGDRSFEVLHLPGHSPGSIGLWEAATGVLFSGDAIYDGPLLDGLDDSDIDAYRVTMERLRALPVTVVHAGHEASFGRQRLVELCDAYLAAPQSVRRVKTGLSFEDRSGL
ncbi:MAG: MBL fold metallo-hydrolase [Actinomycetia bacterium]|nr:MBL fold metallo-hydrolase [Actinomycetes bacterium]